MYIERESFLRKGGGEEGRCVVLQGWTKNFFFLTKKLVIRCLGAFIYFNVLIFYMFFIFLRS